MRESSVASKYRKAGLAVRKLAVALKKLKINEKGSKTALGESEGSFRKKI